MRRLFLLLLWPLLLYGQGTKVQQSNAADLPPATSPSVKNSLFMVMDGASTTDCTVGGGTSSVLCQSNGTIWVPVPGNGGTPGGSPPQTQVNDPGNPGHFGGSGCQTFPSLSVGPVNVNCDTHNKGPNPWFDITLFGARALVPPAQTTTATCTATSVSVTLASAIDFQNGDGITLTECGAATSLSTPAAPSSVTPRGILNGASTVSYKIRAEDYSNGRTATSVATTIGTANGTFGTIVRTITNASLVSGIITVTTSTNHNFQAGEKVKITGTSTIMDAVWRVSSITNPTVFTIQTQFVRSPNLNVTVSTGTAESPSHIWVNWTAATNVLRYLIYRQDGGAGNYNLVGVAQGREPFYDDYGFGITATDVGPNVPTTDAIGAQPQTLATTIASGAGTVNIVVANAAVNSKSGSSALHDNTIAWLAASNAALNSIGGEVLVPNAGNGQFYLTFPLQIPSSVTGPANSRINGTVAAQQPIIPGSFQSFYGSGGNQGGKPSFQSSYYGGQILGKGNPLIFLAGTTSVSFDHMEISGDSNSKQQWLILVDNGPTTTGGSVSTQITNSYVSAANAPAGSAAVVLRGIGFGTLITNDVLSNGGGGSTTYMQQGSLRLMGSTVSSPQGSPGIGTVRDTTMVAGGVRVDGDALNGASMLVGSAWTFDHVFTESLCNPVFDFQNILSNNAGGWTINNLNAADAACGAQTPNLDLSGIAGTFVGLLVNNGGSINVGPGTTIAASVSGITSSGDDSLPTGSVVTRSGKFNVGAGSSSSRAAPGQALEVAGGGIRITSLGKVFTDGDPPTGLSCTVQAGGSLPVGVQPITVTAADFDFGESEQSAPFPVTLSTGNQTINCSWTAPSPAPFGYYLYVNGARTNGGFITGTSIVQSVIGGASGPAQSGGGPSGMSKASGTWASQFDLVGTTGFSTKLTGTFSANRTATWPDASGQVALSTVFNSAYDNFNRANGALGSNWATQTVTWNVSGNTVSPTTVAANSNVWIGSNFGPDQFSQATIVTAATSIGVQVRGSTVTQTNYEYHTSTTARTLFRCIAGSCTQLATVASGVVAGDVIRLEVQGTNLTAFRNGVIDLTASDSQVASGQPGIESFGTTTGVFDNWSGGNLHPIAQLDTEQDWTQPQHFIQPVTIGPTNPVAGALTTGLGLSQINLYSGANVATMTWLAQNATGNPLLSTSSTPSAKFLDCQNTSTCAQAAVSSPVFFIKGGPVAMSGGTIAITSMPFASSTSYVCTVNDVTATNAVQVVYTSGATVTFNGTTTDSIRYICWGI